MLQLHSFGAYSHGLMQRLRDNPAVIREAAIRPLATVLGVPGMVSL